MPAPKKTADSATVLPVGTPDIPDADSVVADRSGIYWVVAQRKVYRAGFGLHAAVFPASEPQPFADGRKLTAAHVDNAGNAFFADLAVRPRRGGVRPGARRAAENNNCAAHEIRRRPDAGTVRDQRSESAFHLAARRRRVERGHHKHDVATRRHGAGHHRVQVIAIDERLQTDPVPAEISFESRLDTAQRLQRLIAQLGDKDFARREAAVKSLASLPQAALPALKTAREKASDDQRWWIDAAIQEIERKIKVKN